LTILELLKRALDWDAPDYSGMPDYATILDHLGLTADDDPELIRDAIEQEIEALEADGEDADSDAEGGESDVGI
jgi:hypothetical protein